MFNHAPKNDDSHAAAQPPVPGVEAAPGGRRRPPSRRPHGDDATEGTPVSGSDPYLESNRIIVGDGTSYAYEVCPQRCKSLFCEHCCQWQGRQIRERLAKVVETWQSPFMLTLTIDPTLFDDPESAHRYVMRKRAISELIRALRDRGYLNGKHYFCVVEWQKKSQMAHYHLLVDANRIPWDVICELWNRNRPADAGPVVGKRPGFGSVRFSKPTFKSSLHAARYATKYLIKHPENGYPDWVLDYEGRIKRYVTSHGFWKSVEHAEPIERTQSESQPECETEAEVPNEPMQKVRLRSVRERLERCCKEAVLIRVIRRSDDDGEEVEERRFFSACAENFAVIRRLLSVPVDAPTKRFEVDQKIALKLAFPKMYGSIRGLAP